MAKRNQEIWNPFAERVDGSSLKQRQEIERGQAWQLYLNGGGGEPSLSQDEDLVGTKIGALGDQRQFVKPVGFEPVGPP